MVQDLCVAMWMSHTASLWKNCTIGDVAVSSKKTRNNLHEILIPGESVVGIVLLVLERTKGSWLILNTCHLCGRSVLQLALHSLVVLPLLWLLHLPKEIISSCSYRSKGGGCLVQ